MKKTQLYIGFLLATLTIFTFSSCDEIEDPVVVFDLYREDLYGPAPEFTPLTAPVRRVLLEDFTGHDCGNCPNGHLAATTIEEEHPDHVAVVAIHAGSLAAPNEPNYPADWTTAEGQYYLLNQVGVDEMPKGRANRTPTAATVYSPSQWATRVDEALAVPAIMDMQMVVDFVPENNHLNVHVNSQWFDAAAGSYRLVIMIAESGIVAPQLWYNHEPSEYIPDYIHNHMLRATITGATGLEVANNPVAGFSQTDSYTSAWNSDWQEENCDVIAIITEGETGKIMNVVKKAVVE